MMSKTVTIFYSWQSDLVQYDNEEMIRKGLESAIENVEEIETGVELVIDEAAKDMPGARNIEVELFGQIVLSDIFVCDVSIVNQECDCISGEGGIREMPNPNVLLELGYAAGCLGWDRIILVFNKASGKVEELPFDIRGRVTSPYFFDGEDKESIIEQLSNDLKKRIEIIVKADPPKPILNDVVNKVRRQRDIKTLYDLLSFLSFPILIHYIYEDAPNYRSADLVKMIDIFRASCNSQIVHFYDEKLRELFFSLYSTIDKSLKYDNLFHSIGNGEKFHITFSTIDPNSEEKKQYSELNEAREQLAKSIYDFQYYVKEHYIEVDLNETDSNAHSFLKDGQF